MAHNLSRVCGASQYRRFQRCTGPPGGQWVRRRSSRLVHDAARVSWTCKSQPRPSSNGCGLRTHFTVPKLTYGVQIQLKRRSVIGPCIECI
jgi:hypothetical protein